MKKNNKNLKLSLNKETLRSLAGQPDGSRRRWRHQEHLRVHAVRFLRDRLHRDRLLGFALRTCGGASRSAALFSLVTESSRSVTAYLRQIG